MRSECDRTRLISDLACLLRECDIPTDARAATLTLIGFLARRMPGEAASDAGVAEVAAQARAFAALHCTEDTAPGSGTHKKPCAA